jgi:CHAT domain-containing protein/Flp pilus assembly protein TadD
MSEKAEYYYKLGKEHYNNGEYTKAIECYLKVADILEREQGKEHPDYATLLSVLGSLYHDMKNYARAEECYLESKAIREKVLGKEHPDYFKLLNNMGVLYQDMKNYKRAEEYFLESKAIRGRTLGKEHPDYIKSFNNLGVLYYDMGDFVRAEEYYLESKDIMERTFGKENSDYASSLDNLGSLYYNTGDYARAEKCYLESKAIRQRVLGKEHPDYAESLNNLGSLYCFNGDYALAEECYLESKDILEKVCDKENPDYASLLNIMGLLYHDKGDYKRAEEYLLESKDICERVLGKEHPDYAKSLNDLGSLYHSMGDYNRAEEYYLGAKAIMEKVLGKEHINYATLLNNIGELYHDKGDNKRAEEYYLESKAIRKSIIGENHPDYATSLNNLGLLYYNMGGYARAEELLLESKALEERLLGKEHPDYIPSLNNLYLLYLTERKYEKAIEYKKVVNQKNMDLVNRIFTFLSSREREKYWNTRSSSFESSYSLSWFYPVPESNVLNYNNALFTKGLLLRTANEVRDSVYSSGDKELITQYDGLNSLRQKIGNLQQRGDGNQTYIKGLEDQAERLEKLITQASTAFRESQTDLALKWQDVRDSLQSGEAAIEFLSFKLFDKERSSAIQYAALVLRSGMDAPEWIPLPHCEEILLEFLKKQNEKTKEPEKMIYNENSFELYAAVWQPIEKTLEGIRTVYYSPSGLLHKISFNAIPVKKSLRLTDVYDLSLVSSTREIVRRKKQQEPGSGVVYGGLQYTMDEEDMKQNAQLYHKPDAENQEETDLPDKLRKSNILQQYWEMLPYMEKEGIDIQEILLKNNVPVDLYMGAKGNKESFMNLDKKKKNVLHLSTHGFFLSDIEKNYEERKRLMRLGGGPKVFENPLMLSGLLLAGCNNAWKGKPVVGVGNGILFADDVARMDLLGAQLVVLSACETGLGEVNNSEGVFGLQRAFKLAGAETLIMSLWSVSDQATSELMKSFYEKWLNKGKSKQEAFKEAQRELRARPEYSSPFYWAAFVMID